MSRSQKRALAVAIDGPAGAGKSTVARAVARALGYTYVDTGAMYRAATLACLEQDVDLSDPEAVARTVAASRITLEQGEEGLSVFLDGRDVTQEVRSPQVGEAVSRVAQVPAVREALVRMQRELGARGAVVMDGRDIGTVVLPAADVKVFLTASIDERARRRHRELLEAGERVTFEEVVEALRRRDAQDAGREHSPLRRADDAVAIDTTGHSVDEVVRMILDLCRARGGAPCGT